MKRLLFGLLFISLSSCITIRKAPKITTHKISTAKKFQRKFPKEKAFIFEDPKNADEFYHFINTKFKLNDIDVGFDVPITINNKTYYFTYYEAEIPDKKFNLLGLAVDATLKVKGMDPLFDEGYVKRNGHWYIAITVYDEENKNCLKSKYPNRKAILDYLRLLHNEYLHSPTY
ncbi:hypothetical protein [Winogradskyella sp.]|jgi:hypothetical protein|uniref:hypothetical protein n=1 Tax=Winogradskyella sp. TaxID=1883156 RepID=UPI0025DE4789|nr:hypothetical protein [Winogradskyella sp.]MCT4629283.1 hypothetical protein [Winogradskyella sp.]